MAIVTFGIELAKNVFAVHGVDEAGKPTLVRPELPRAKLLELIANLPPCLIGMEACSGAHHWAREFAKFGHTVRMMAPKFVVPYRMSGKRGKSDAADAAAICEADTVVGDALSELTPLLIMGGKAVLSAAKNKTDPVSRWAISVQQRRGYWKAVVAIAAKNARMCWAMLQRGEGFKMPA